MEHGGKHGAWWEAWSMVGTMAYVEKHDMW